jgi:PAS domain S-box-containing protein
MKVITSLFRLNRGDRKGFFNPTNFFRLIHKAAGTPAFIKSFLYLLIALFIFCPPLFSQTKIDSLETKLSRFSGTDIEKVNILNELAKEHSGISNKKLIELGRQALQLAQKIDYKKGKVNSLNNIAAGYFYLSKYDTALEYYLKSLRISEELKNKESIAKSLNNIGVVYKLLGNYKEALKYFLKSLKLKQDIGNRYGTASALNNIGMIYGELKNYKKALEYFLKSLEIKEENKDRKGTATALNNIGMIYYKLNNYEKTLEYLLKSLKISEETGFKTSIANTSINIGDSYIKLKEYDTASLYFEQGLKLAKEIEAKYLLKDCYNSISNLYFAKGSYQKALKYYKIHSDIKDSIFTKESSEKIAEMQTRYETEKKEKEIEILSKNNKIQNLEIVRQRNLRNSFIVISILIAILVFIIYRLYRAIQKTNVMLKEENIQTEKENIELTDKNIQTTVQKDRLAQALNELQKSQKIIGERTEELNKTKLQFETILNTSPMHIAFVDINGKYNSWNKASEVMFGYKTDEAIGKLSPGKLFKNKKEARKTIYTAMRKGIFDGEAVLIRKDGFEFPVRFLAVKTVDFSGVHNGFTVAAIDITERRQSEEELKRYKLMVETSNDVMFIKDLESRYILVNKKTLEVFGDVPAEKIINKNDKEIMPQKDAEHNITDDQKVFKSRKIKDFVKKNIIEGKEYWFHATKIPLKGDKGKVIGLIGIARDITGQKRAEGEIRKLSRIVKTTPEAIILTDLLGKIEYINEGLLTIGGFKDAGEMIGKSVFLFSDENGVKSLKEEVIPTLLAGKNWKGEIPVKRKDGSIFPAEMICSLVLDDENQPKYLLSHYHDITDRKQAEEALQESEGKYRTLFQSADDAIFLMRDDRFVDCNQATEIMFGCSRHQIIGHCPYEFSPDRQPDGRESKEKSLENINSALAGKHEYFEWTHCRANGKPFDTEVKLDLMNIGQDKMVLAIVRDVTERKVADQKLRENERHFSLLEEEIIDLHKKLTGDRKIIGKSKVMENMFSMIEKVAKTDSAVIICGETGTGKESVAHAIHVNSPRKDKPFGIVDCASIPKELLETELFGHEKGSFTGAHARKKGLFETSNCGAIFLDEISELPLSLQSKLLRALQEHDIKRVGGTKRIKTDVRIIAATNKDLKGLIKEAKFREDLYFRLNVFPINIPPLRERGEDIMLLAHYFLNLFGRNKNKKAFTKDAQAALESYKWPGNVRELQHKIERAIILSDSENITGKDLEMEKQINEIQKDYVEKNLMQQGFIINEDTSLKKIIEIVKKKAIDEILEKCKGNISKAAEILDITRETIYKIRKGEED